MLSLTLQCFTPLSTWRGAGGEVCANLSFVILSPSSFHPCLCLNPAFHSSPRPEKQEGLKSVRGLPLVASACQTPLTFVPAGCHFSQGQGVVIEREDFFSNYLISFAVQKTTAYETTLHNLFIILYPYCPV